MGTRADFYTHKDSPEGWLGSIAWDGCPDGVPELVIQAATVEEFHAAVAKILDEDKSATTPDMGWPWPWEDGHLTDYSYVWGGESVEVYNYGRPDIPYPENATCEEINRIDREVDAQPKIAFPDMSEIQAVTLGERSGVIVVGL